MKKKFSNLLFILLTLIIAYEVLNESELVISTVKLSYNIWINNIFPSLFPFFIISSLLISLNFHEILGNLLKNITYKLFKINKYSSFIIILSMLSGSPSSSKNIKELYDKNLINEKEASKLLTFTHFTNPLFILGTVSTFVGDKELALPILISHYIGNFIIGLLIRNWNKSELSDIHTIPKNKKNDSFGNVLTKSISSSINTLLLILGTVTIFLILTTLINNLFNFSDLFKCIFTGLFEITSGLKYLEILNLSSNIKGLIAVAILSFGGLSIHMQTITIISDTKIKYFPYFLGRIFHAFISSFIFFIWKVF